MAVGLAGCAAGARGGGGRVGTTVYLVRHAEKEAFGNDPGLTVGGRERAKALAETLGGEGIGAVYVTQYRRTRETAAPTAGALGVTPVVFPATGSIEEHARAVASDIMEHHAGKRVLVVGHSNTVGRIAEALGAGRVGDLGDDEFDALLVVRVARDGGATLERRRYGGAR